MRVRLTDMGSANPQRITPAEEPRRAGYWPLEADHEPVMKIGQVLDLLKREFPALRISKLRYLEEKNIIAPRRTSSGYRMYSHADVERLRYCMSAQRDYYWPLDRIHEELAQLDAGYEAQTPQVARVISDNGKLVGDFSPDARVTVRQLRDTTGISDEDLDELLSLGILKMDAASRLSGRSIAIAQLAMLLRSEGVRLNQLRFLTNSTSRMSDVVETVANIGRNPRNPASVERSRAKGAELGQLLLRMLEEMVRISLEP
ncbi:MAG: MerR family transcriptional regulator [Varibaculum sp.]|nr:MerR family transcriptional regulator [Varibaculum sp.]